MTASAVGFAPFAPVRRGGKFATTWWGGAWVDALEDTALDLRQLREGRKLAKSAAVGSITVSPGRIGAAVDDGESHSASVRVPTFDDSAWDRLVASIAERAAHLAALLDGQLPRDLSDTATDIGLDLVPALGDIDSECTCDGWELPCKHAAAIAYQAGWLIDDDPFLVLLVRGRGRDEVLEQLRASAPTAGTSSSARAMGVPATAAYARIPGPLPRIPAPQPSRSDAPSAELGDVHSVVESAAKRALDVLNGADERAIVTG